MRTGISPMLITVMLLLSTLIVAMPVKTLKPGTDFSGIHFNLNIHGVPNGVEKPVPDDAGTGRKSIFVPLTNEEPITIEFAQYGDEWQVLDCDATGDGKASIVLPRNVCVEEVCVVDDVTGEEVCTCQTWKRAESYKVYLAAHGKPVELAEIILDPEAILINGSAQAVYDWGALTLPGHKNGKMGGKGGGKPVWENATGLFLVNATILIWNEDLGDYEPITFVNEWVFNLPLDSYWWEVTNKDVRLLKIRFYPVFKGNGNGNGNGNNG